MGVAVVCDVLAMTRCQLLIQYKLNFWSRDLFNAIEAKNEIALRAQALVFLPLAATSLLLTVLSVWSRMTTEREWRRWLSKHLYDRWLRSDHHLELKFMHGGHQTPEHRIAEDVRVATDLPIDLVVGLISSLLTGAAFAGILWSVGGTMDFNLAGIAITIPGYLVVAATLYSLLLTSVTLTFGRQAGRCDRAQQGCGGRAQSHGDTIAFGRRSSVARQIAPRRPPRDRRRP